MIYPWYVYPYRQSIRTRVVSVDGAEPVTVKRALANRRDIDTSSDRKAEIESLIKSAREAAENFTEKSIVQKTLEAAGSCFGDFHNFELPYGPVRTIESVTYIDTDGATQTLDEDVYDLDAFRGVVIRSYGESFPSARYVTNAVTVRYTAGYDDAGDSPEIHIRPEAITRAILLLIGNWDENREGTADNKLAELPLGVQYLLNPYRLVGV